MFLVRTTKLLVYHHGLILEKKKFVPKWDVIYVGWEVYINGTYKLIDKDGMKVDLTNGKF